VRALRNVWRMETHLVARDGDKIVIDRERSKSFRAT